MAVAVPLRPAVRAVLAHRRHRAALAVQRGPVQAFLAVSPVRALRVVAVIPAAAVVVMLAVRKPVEQLGAITASTICRAASGTVPAAP